MSGLRERFLGTDFSTDLPLPLSVVCGSTEVGSDEASDCVCPRSDSPTTFPSLSSGCSSGPGMVASKGCSFKY